METEKKSVKSILKSALKQLGVSAVILVIGIVLLNYSAYSIIAKHYWNKLWGIEVETPMENFADTNTLQIEKTVLKTSQDIEVQKRQIPDLNLEITPTDNRLIIPRINQNIPIVRISSENLLKRDWNGLEKEMQSALQDGVVHYPGTSTPGESGNTAITGHSSYFPWDPGRFKDVFALLHDVVVGDDIVVYWDQHKHIYQVTDIKIILPDDIEVLKQTPDERLTLITCHPVGTNLKRLIVTAKPVEETKSEKVLR